MEDSAHATTPANTGSRNIIIFAIVVVLLLLGVGVYYVLGRSMTAPATQTTVQTTATPTPASMFTSIQDALAKSLSLQCTYEEDGKTTIAYIKAGAVRADSTGGTPAENGSVIVKDDTMYFWNGKQGMMVKFDREAMQKQAESMKPSTTPGKALPSQAPQANVMQNLEKYKDACKPATVADTLFTPPTDVKFVDQTKMMENAQKMMQGVTPGQGVNEDDVKKMMEQYQPSPTVSN